MAKKYNKHIDIDSTELKSTTIGEISTKKKSIIPLIIVFAFFLAVVYFLPNITEYIEEYQENKNPTNDAVTPPNNTNTDDSEDENDDETEDKIEYKENVELSNEKINLSDIVIEDEVITFKLKNISGIDINLEETNYYLELYSEDTLLQRISLEKNIIVASDETEIYEIKTEITNMIYLKLSEITPDEYPQVTLEEDEDNISIMTCEIDGKNTVYTFEDKELIEIEITITMNSTEKDYTAYFDQYESLSKEIDSYVGAVTDFDETDDNFEYNVRYDLTEFANYGEVDLKYTLESTAEEIKFKSESNGEDCN